jgi:hypothetical protein
MIEYLEKFVAGTKLLQSVLQGLKTLELACCLAESSWLNKQTGYLSSLVLIRRQPCVNNRYEFKISGCCYIFRI